MKKVLVFCFVTMFCATMVCSQNKSNSDKIVGGPCDGCQAMFEGMPSGMSWDTKIAGPDEPGEQMIISGTIYRQDGKTPAPDIILYVYHTNREGLYSPSPGQTNGKRHGHLRGWMKTNDQGHYQFMSIRPAAYPSRKAPQHVHVLIKEPGKTLYWIDEYLFEDDPLLTPTERSRQEKRGGTGIIQLVKNNKGVWVGHRDIILGVNVPDYQ